MDALERRHPVGGEILDEFTPLRIREAGTDAHVLQVAGPVMEAEQQRPHRGPIGILMPAKAGNDAVALARVLHLQHHALVRLVDPGRVLRHDAVEPGALEAPEPIRGNGMVACRRGEVERGHDPGKHRLQRRASLFERGLAKIPVPLAKEVEEDEGGGELPRKLVYPGRRRVKTKLERFEVQPAGPHNHDFAIQNAAVRKLRFQRLEQLGIVAGERLLIPALDEDLIAVSEDERAKSVPFRFEYPAVAGRQLTDRFGEHGQDRWIDREMHYDARGAQSGSQ